jgi:hypothetical protein
MAPAAIRKRLRPIVLLPYIDVPSRETVPTGGQARVR